MSLTTRPVLAVAGLSLLTAVAACGTVSYSQQADNLPLPVFSVHGLLDSVAAASSNDAWAVGYSGTAQDAHTLMFRWDGRTWSRVTSPDVVDGVPGLLSDVTVVSASDAWAAGFTRVVHSSLESAQTLLLHWDGTRWSRVAVQPAVGALSGITTSGHSGWAVGTSGVAGQQQPLILRWDGKRWHRVPAPAGSGGLYLTKVVATSAGAAAVDRRRVGRGPRPERQSPEGERRAAQRRILVANVRLGRWQRHDNGNRRALGGLASDLALGRHRLELTGSAQLDAVRVLRYPSRA